MSAKENFGRDQDALRLTVVVWVFGYILVGLTMALQGKAPFPLTLLSQVPLFFVGVGMVVGLRRLVGAVERMGEPLRLAALGLTVVVCAVALTLVDLGYHWLLGRTIAPGWAEWSSSFTPERFMVVALLYLWTLGLNVSLFWASSLTERARRQEARAASAETAAHRAEAAALRLQLNPHFLFNALNAIASLTVTRRNEDATLMIGELADFLRSSLANDPTGLAPLRDELATAGAYLRIENVRFPDRMRLTLDAAPELGRLLVPNFLLQPLVENAIKHGVAPSRRPVEISVRAWREGEGLLAIDVQNRTTGRARAGAAAPPSPPGASIGLANVRQRLSLLFGDQASLTTTTLADGFSATVRLPAIEKGPD